MELPFRLSGIAVRPVVFQAEWALRRTRLLFHVTLAALCFLPSGQLITTFTVLCVGHHTSINRRSARMAAA